MAVGANNYSPLPQGVWMLFPPFKGDSRGLDNKLTHSSIVSGLARRGIISQYPFIRVVTLRGYIYCGR